MINIVKNADYTNRIVGAKKNMLFSLRIKIHAGYFKKVNY